MPAWIVTSSAVVGSSAIRMLGSHDERHRDHHALAHPAGELVGVLVDPALRIGDVHEVEQLDRAGPRLAARDVVVPADDLGDLLADAEHRVERGHRLLEDERDPLAAHVAQVRRGGVAAGRRPRSARSP